MMTKIRSNILYVLIFFAVLYSVLIIRLFIVQIVQGEDYRKRSEKQRQDEVVLAPDRGDIFDRNGNLLATTVDSYSIGVLIKEINDKRQTAARLSRAMNIDQNKVYGLLSSKRSFVFIERKVDSQVKEAVKELKLKGIRIDVEPKRIYPKNRLLAHVLGFVGTDNKGLAGVEQEFDSDLRGMEERFIIEKDAKREILAPNVRGLQEPTNGKNITLTIDEPIQFVAEKSLKKAVLGLKAASGTVLVIDVKSGEILALAIYPDFDPNDYQKAGAEIWCNKAVTGAYEPGSTFKLVTIASALQDGTITPNSTVYCPDIITVGKRTVKNSHTIKFETRDVSPAMILEQSINTGAAKIAEKMGKNGFYRGIKNFGFGERTGIELPGESRGILRDTSQWAEIDLDTISFGQGIAVTPIQLIYGLSSIANKGVRMKPRIVRSIETADKGYIKLIAPEQAGTALSEKAAMNTLLMSEDVITKGTGKSAAIKDFFVGGKTGTAQTPDRGGYLEGSYFSSFIGFVPLTRPEISVLVIIENPKTEYWGEKTAAPVFREVAEFALRRLNIAPDNANVKDPKGMI